MDDKRCTGKKKDGSPCGAHRLKGSDFCMHHDPKRSAKISARRQQAVKLATQGDAPTVESLSPTTMEECSELCSETIQKLRNDEISPKVADSIANLLRVKERLLRGTKEAKITPQSAREMSEEELAAHIDRIRGGLKVVK